MGVDTPRSASMKRIVIAVCKYGAGIVAAIIALLPVWWMFNVVFAEPGSALALHPRLYPSSFSAGVHNVEVVLKDGVFLRAMLNSFLYSSAQVAGVLIVGSAAAYEFAHGRFRGKNALYTLTLVGLMVPIGVTVLPTQRIVSHFGWLNTFHGIAVPGMASAFAVFLLTEYMRAVPTELIEAAQLDGVSRFGILWRIAIPLCRNGLLAVGILIFILSWGNYIWPLVVATDPSKYPVSVAVAGYFAPQSHQTTNVIMTAALLTSIPLILIYVLLQRWIVDSIARVGVRG